MKIQKIMKAALEEGGFANIGAAREYTDSIQGVWMDYRFHLAGSWHRSGGRSEQDALARIALRMASCLD